MERRILRAQILIYEQNFFFVATLISKPAARTNSSNKIIFKKVIPRNKRKQK
jgi:hypothetical protein